MKAFNEEKPGKIAREYYSIAAYHLEDFLRYRYTPETIVYELEGKLRQCYVKDFFERLDKSRPYQALLRGFCQRLRDSSQTIE